MGCWLDLRGIVIVLLAGSRDFPLLLSTQYGSGTHLGLLFGGYPLPETDHSPSFIAEIKNAWSHNSTLPYIFAM
jgi:hypothetical protein